MFPVRKTEAGNIRTLICREGSYPDADRALAANWDELLYRPVYPEPWVWSPSDMWVVQNMAHAIHNTFYCLAPDLGIWVQPER